jgi:glucoamylase
VTERPADTTDRYLTHTQSGTTVTLTTPAQNSLSGPTTTVSGSTAPGARIDVDAVDTDSGTGAAAMTSGTADATGSFSLTVAVPPGTVVLTVTATAPDGATGFAQRTVVRDVAPGTLIFATTDPDGDDNGPGTYAYPTSDNFRPGAYDLQRFEVYDSGPDKVTFRIQTRDLTPTFGNPIGAQLVDLYVRNPGAGGATSTAASFPQRNYTIAAGSAWNRLIEVQGFGQRFVDATGATVGAVTTGGNAVTRYITATVSKSALGGTPASGWGFTVVLHGQDGFSPDQARGFQPTPQDYQFGVCAPGGASPICAVNPDTVPKAMDVLTPSGVSQAEELDPTQPPATIAGVTVP